MKIIEKLREFLPEKRQTFNFELKSCKNAWNGRWCNRRTFKFEKMCGEAKFTLTLNRGNSCQVDADVITDIVLHEAFTPGRKGHEDIYEIKLTNNTNRLIEIRQDDGFKRFWKGSSYNTDRPTALRRLLAEIDEAKARC